MQAMRNTDFMEYLPDKQRVRLKYRGSERVVVVTGIKKEYVESMLSDFKSMYKRGLRIVIRRDKYEI